MKLCNLNTAQALQKLGYDGYYNYIYAKNTESSLRYIGFKEVFELSEYTGPPAPRLDDAAYWLREHYKILITIDYVWYDGYQYSISQNFAKKRPNVVLSVGYDTYDSALEAAVEAGIQAACKYLIKQKDNGK